MKMRIHTLALTALAVIAMHAVPTARAATITWGTPTGVTGVGASIVDTSGTLVKAVNYTAGVQLNANRTANGVTFISTGTIEAGWGNTFFDVTVYNDGSPGTFDDFERLMQGFMHGSTVGETETLTLTGLTGGNSYLVQFFISDDRTTGSPAINTRTQTLIGGANTSAVITVGSSVSLIGTFTADAATQAVGFDPGGSWTPIINAFQLRQLTVIPAPASLPAGLAMFGLAAMRRRRTA